MANCQDLINVLADINQAVLALNINVDAVRQAVLCQTELLRESFPTRQYIASCLADHLQMQAETIQATVSSLNQVARALGALNVPPAYQKSLVYTGIQDLGYQSPCSITEYCPPGQIKNEGGECVPVGGGVQP